MARHYYVPPMPYGGGYYRQPTSIKTILILTALVLLALGGTYWYLKRKATADAREQTPDEYSDEKYTKEESNKIRSYSTQIVEDLKGATLYHNNDMYEALLNESQKIFVGVAIDYKLLTGNSLKKDLDDDFSFSFQAPTAQLRKRLVALLLQYNLF